MIPSCNELFQIATTIRVRALFCHDWTLQYCPESSTTNNSTHFWMISERTQTVMLDLFVALGIMKVTTMVLATSQFLVAHSTQERLAMDRKIFVTNPLPPTLSWSWRIETWNWTWRTIRWENAKEIVGTILIVRKVLFVCTLMMIERMFKIVLDGLRYDWNCEYAKERQWF